MRTLHQFPISHFCEKTRWNLDAKGLRFRVKNLLPGVHQLVRPRGANVSTLPILRDGAAEVADSSDIALYLERTYPGRAVVPEDGPDRARALSLEDYFDETLGPAVRRWMYGASMVEHGAVPKAFFHGYGPVVQKVGHALGGLFELGLRKKYRIRAETIAKSFGHIQAACERLELEVSGDPSRYLVGDALGIADITAASLLGPVVAPPGSPWHGFPFPAVVTAECDKIRARVAGRWVAERYAKDRRPCET